MPIATPWCRSNAGLGQLPETSGQCRRKCCFVCGSRGRMARGLRSQTSSTMKWRPFKCLRPLIKSSNGERIFGFKLRRRSTVCLCRRSRGRTARGFRSQTSSAISWLPFKILRPLMKRSNSERPPFSNLVEDELAAVQNRSSVDQDFERRKDFGFKFRRRQLGCLSKAFFR